MVPDHDRRLVFTSLSRTLGDRPATVMMELLAKGEMAELRGELRAQLPELIAANIASVVAVSGLVLAVATLV